jgi:Flp pilus assembly protein TadG
MHAMSMVYRRSARRFFRNDTGVAATEFALIVPVILLLLLGSTDLTEAVSARRKVVLVANTAADLIAQVTEVDGTYLNNVFMSSTAVGTPLDARKLAVVISSVTVNGNGTATVLWSQGKNKPPRVARSAYPLPEDLKSAKTFVVAEVQFEFTPIIGHAVTGSLNFSETAYATPRPSEAAQNGVRCTSGC